MRIAIVGSVSFVEKMRETRDRLLEAGHEVHVPSSAELNQNKDYWNDFKKKNFDDYQKILKERNINYWKKIESVDAVLVLNLTKNNVKNYIGPSTLMEIAVAFEHGKKIFLFNSFPEDDFARDELDYISPIVINTDLTKIV